MCVALQRCQRRSQLPPIVCLFLPQWQRFRHISGISEEDPVSPHPPNCWVDLGRSIREDDVPAFLLEGGGGGGLGAWTLGGGGSCSQFFHSNASLIQRPLFS